MRFEFTLFNENSDSLRSEHRKFRISTFIFSLFSLITITYFAYTPVNKTIGSTSGIKAGDIVSKDIIVQQDITFEDKERTDKLRQEKKKDIPPVYTFDSESVRNTSILITDFFAGTDKLEKEYKSGKVSLRKSRNKFNEVTSLDISSKDMGKILKERVFSDVNLNQLLDFIKDLQLKGIVLSKRGIRKDSNGYIAFSGREGRVKGDNLYDLQDIKLSLLKYFKDSGNTMPELVSGIVKDFIKTNTIYSPELTTKSLDENLAKINPVIVTLKRGRVILRKGDVINPNDIKLIRKIASLEQISGTTIPQYYFIFIFTALMILFLHSFYSVWQLKTVNRSRLFAVTVTTFAVSAIIYRIALFVYPVIIRNLSLTVNYDDISIFLGIPFAVGALIIAFTFNLPIAVLFSFLNAILSGIICNWNFGIVIYVLISNITVCYGIEYYQRVKRSPIIKTSLFWLLPVNLIGAAFFSFSVADTSTEQLITNLAMSTVSALATPVIANFIIPVWEIIFKLVTELKLIELTNLNLPIFREMLEKAPGTYHHSQMVASLAEAAAQDLECSPALVTAMALYHDIGKIDNPQFFTENHSIYPNPHPGLSPRESSRNIISHINDGLERARKLKLPPVVSSAITQHHGTKLVKFFYDKAREEASMETDEFDASLFRYPGNKPQNIENAIIMLADQIEAASKSLAAPKDEEIINVIGKIIDTNIEDRQFDECEELTFKALNTIANSFYKKLSSIYHMRISYPGFNFKEKQKEAETDDKLS